jgi:hypothetical protein
LGRIFILLSLLNTLSALNPEPTECPTWGKFRGAGLGMGCPKERSRPLQELGVKMPAITMCNTRVAKELWPSNPSSPKRHRKTKEKARLVLIKRA